MSNLLSPTQRKNRIRQARKELRKKGRADGGPRWLLEVENPTERQRLQLLRALCLSALPKMDRYLIEIMADPTQPVLATDPPPDPAIMAAAITKAEAQRPEFIEQVTEFLDEANSELGDKSVRLMRNLNTDLTPFI